MATSNLFVSPDQGWVLAATGPIGYARISVGHHCASWFVALSPTLPASTVIGQSVVGKTFWINTNITDNVYIRVGAGQELDTGSGTGLTTTGTLGLRVDVLTGPTNATGGGGGGGGAATIADGADVAEGSTISPAYTDTTGAAAGTIVGILKGLYVGLKGLLTVVGNVASGVADSGNPVKVGGKFSATLPTLVDQNRGDFATTNGGAILAAVSGISGSSTDGLSNSSVIQPVSGTAANNATTARTGLATCSFFFNGTTWDRQRKPNTFSRLSVSAVTGSPTLVKATAGDISNWWGQNGAVVTYLQLYNKATAPVIGTDTPVLTYPIAASSVFNGSIPNGGAYFPTGIGYAFTTDAAGTAAAAASAVTGFAILVA